MYLTKKSKFKVTLLISTVIASVFALPEAAYGATRLLQQKAQQEQEKAVLQAQVAVGGANIVGLTQYKDALANPAGALVAAGPTDLTAILGLAVGDGASAANALPLVNDADKMAAMRAVEGGGGGDAPHKAAIRTALGLDPNPAAANHVAITADVRAFYHDSGRTLSKISR